MRPGRARTSSQSIVSFKNCLNGKLGEMWIAGLGLTLSNVSGVDYVMSWTGQLAGISITAGTTANAPIYAVDTGYFKGNKVVQCAVSGPRYLGLLGMTSPAPIGTSTDNPRWFLIGRLRTNTVALDGVELFGMIAYPNYMAGGNSHVRFATMQSPVRQACNYYISSPNYNNYGGPNVAQDLTVPRWYDYGVDPTAVVSELRCEGVNWAVTLSAAGVGSSPINRFGKANYFGLGSEAAIGGNPSSAGDLSVAMCGYATSPLTADERDSLKRLAMADLY